MYTKNAGKTQKASVKEIAEQLIVCCRIWGYNNDEIKKIAIEIIRNRERPLSEARTGILQRSREVTSGIPEPSGDTGGEPELFSGLQTDKRH